MNFAQPKVTMLLGLNSANLKQGLDKAKALTGKFVSDVQAKLKSISFSGASGGENIFSKISGFFGGGLDTGSMFSGLNSKLGMLAAGIGLVTTMGVKATTMAMDWERSMAKVNVTAQLQKNELRDLDHEVLQIAGRNATAFEDTPQALNKIVSAGMDVNSAMKMLEPTLKAARAGFAEVETVAGSAVSVMASSGVDDATRVYDILFATLNKGNAEFTDIANYLPKIIPGARNAGIALEDVAGAYAYLTAQGFKAEAAATGLQNVFKSFTDGKTIEGFRKIGVHMFDIHGNARGLSPILDDLQKSLSGLTDKQRIMKLDKVGLDQEASMALSSMLQDYEKLQGVLGFVNNSQGEFNKAIDNAANSTDNWATIVNRLKKSVIELGQVLLPLAEALSHGVDNTMNFINWGGSKLENSLRWITGQMSIQEEFQFNQEQKLRKDKQQQHEPFMHDKRINSYVQKDAANWFLNDRNADPEALLEYGMANAKLIHGYKKTVENALDSKNPKVKALLKQYGVGNTEDFYKLMDSGKAPEASWKLEGLMPKTVKPGGGNAGGKGAGTKAANDAGVGTVVNGAKNQKVTNIHIENFIGGNVISQANAIKNMSKEELQNFFREAMKRAVIDFENGND